MVKRVEEATFGRVSGALHNADFFRGQFVEFIHQRVDLLIGGVDLALVEVFLIRDLGGGELLMQREHALDEGDHLLMPRGVGRVVEVDRADGELR